MDLSNFHNARLLVIGDIMIDSYCFGDVKRISPEAPVPVLHIRKRSNVLGGAGNVVSNLVGLGCQVSVVGVCGEDEGGYLLDKLLDNERISSHVFKSPEKPTIVKTRIVSSNQQLIRLDEEEISCLDERLHNEIVKLVDRKLDDIDAVILSDYGKGIFQTENLAQTVINKAIQKQIPVLVDPKGKDWERYSGATCVTPNTSELELVYGDSIPDKDSLVKAMATVRRKYNLQWLLATRGALGMCLLDSEDTPYFVPALAREVYDVSGAGDTVISTLTLGVASGFSFQDATKLANIAAGVVVGKLGTQPVNLFELQSASLSMGDGLSVNFSNKIVSFKAAEIQARAWQADNKKVVFTNGCFDLLHPGHINLLHQAKDYGDYLVVGLNADQSVKRLKGPTRPVLNEHDRASLLSALDCVDLVVIFTEDTPERLIETLKPDILVKGKDYTPDQVVGHEIVESYGGEVKLVPLLKGYSTTEITNKILAINGK